MGLLDGKTILVTGASAGIGRAACDLFEREGATVIGTARRPPAGGMARFIAADLARPAEVDRLFATIEAEHGALDGAFNNAGISQDAIPLPDTPPELFDSVFDINVRAMWLCLRHELRIMRARKRGAIVNTASIAGLRGYRGLSVYTASKHAVIGLTKAAALDAAEYGVRVNCICPGTTRSGMMERQMLTRPGGEAATLKTIPLNRIAQPAEQANAAAWLLSDAASFVTGDAMVVDGGRTIA